MHLLTGRVSILARKNNGSADVVSLVPYPFLTHASFPVRIAIYAGATAFALGSFKVLNGLHA